MVSNESKSSRLVYYSIFFLIIVFGLVLRFSTFQFFYADWFGHYNFFDTDSYYYLRRLVHFLENFPHAMSFDPLLAWPEGRAVDWPSVGLWIYGLPLWILGVDNFRSLELGASLISVGLGSFTCLVIYLASAGLFDRPTRLLVLFLASLSPLIIRYSCLGQVDHHILEVLVVSLSLWIVLTKFESRSAISIAALGVIWAISIGISSSNLFTIAAWSIGMAVVWANRIYFKNYLVLLGSFTCAYLFVAAAHADRWTNAFDLRMPSLFQGFLGAIFLLIPTLFCRIEKPKHRIQTFFVLLGLLGLSLALSPDFRRVLWSAFRYVFGRDGILQNVVEANPLFFRFGDLDLHFVTQNLSFLFPVVLLAPIGILAWNRLSTNVRFLLVGFSLLMIPALAQRRFLHFLLPVYILVSVWLLQAAIGFLKQRQIRVSGAVWAGFIIISVLPGFKYGFAPQMQTIHRIDFSILKELKAAGKIEDTLAWKRLAGEENVETGVWANPNLGHHLTYLTGMGSLVNPFYPWRGLRYDLALRQVQNPEEFVSSLREKKIGLVLLANDFHYFRMLYEMMNLDTSYFYQEKVGATYFQIDKLEKYQWVRLLLHPEESVEGTGDLFVIQLMDSYFYNFVRAFEVRN